MKMHPEHEELWLSFALLYLGFGDTISSKHSSWQSSLTPVLCAQAHIASAAWPLQSVLLQSRSQQVVQPCMHVAYARDDADRMLACTCDHQTKLTLMCV